MDNNNTVQGTQFCDILFNFFMSKSIDNIFATFSLCNLICRCRLTLRLFYCRCHFNAKSFIIKMFVITLCAFGYTNII